MAKYSQELYFEGYFKKNNKSVSFSGTCLFTKPVVITLTDYKRKLIQEKYNSVIFPMSDNFTTIDNNLKECCEKMIDRYFNINYEKRYTLAIVGNGQGEELTLIFGDVNESVETHSTEEEISV